MPAPPRMTVAFAMFCQEYDPDQPTDLRRMATGLGGWSADAAPTVELTLAIGLWNAGGPGHVRCRVGIKRPGDDIAYFGEGDTEIQETGDMAVLPLKFTLTLDRPGIYWAVGEFDGHALVEVPFNVSEAPAPTSQLITQ
jgi:hypothetical protein